MREILFRGKRVDNGEWVEGDLCKSEKKYFIVYDNDFYETGDCCGTHLEANRYLEVIPETVCQYTGLKDKNGKKIFEGDIILYDCNAEYEVYYDDHLTAFRAENSTDIHFLDHDETIEIKVIGTVWDKEE